MDVSDDVVGVVGERVDVLEREHRALERRHAVGGDADDHELQDRILADAIPGAAQRQQAVDHAAPRRRDQHHGEYGAERLRPVRQRRVEQVVRAGPDVEEDQRPEVHDRQPVGEHRPVRRLRDEVVHHAEERRGQEERHRVVPVPPLDQRVLHAGVHRVALEQADRQLERVDDVQQRDGDERRQVEPDRDVEVPLPPLGDGADQVDAERDPHRGDGQIDRPLELGVLLARREPEREGQGGGDDDQLPAPEMERAQPVAEHARLAQPLQRVVDADEDRVAGEGEDGGVGVQRAQPAVGQLGDAAEHVRGHQLQPDDEADEEGDQPPQGSGDHEALDDGVVVLETFGGRGHEGYLQRGGESRRTASSSRTRTAGVVVSSNWPERTAQANAARKPPATRPPAAMRKPMMLTARPRGRGGASGRR